MDLLLDRLDTALLVAIAFAAGRALQRIAQVEKMVHGIRVHLRLEGTE